MTTYHCPSCQGTWSMGPTREMKVLTCGKCLQFKLETAREGFANASQARDTFERLHKVSVTENLRLLQLLGGARNYVTDPVLRAKIHAVAPPAPRTDA